MNGPGIPNPGRCKPVIVPKATGISFIATASGHTSRNLLLFGGYVVGAPIGEVLAVPAGSNHRKRHAVKFQPDE